MARVLFAREFGAGPGHLARLVALASRIRARGHEPVFAVADVARAEATLGAHGFAYVQAPLWQPRLKRPATAPCSYTEILHHRGYLDPEGLLGLVKAWRGIYALVAPMVTLFENAPTAMLASRGSETPRIVCGLGFSTPPRVAPLPNFRTWEPVPRERLEKADARALATVNAVLAKLKLRALDGVSELFDADAEFLCTFPELDHYAAREGGRYCGPIFDRDAGEPAVWPQAGGKRLYVDLKPGTPAFHAAAAALSDAHYSVLWAAPGISEDVLRRYAKPTLKFSRVSVRLAEVTAQADAALLCGTHASVSAMLLAGVPAALFPVGVEQALVSRNATRIGAAVTASPQAQPAEVLGAISDVVKAPRYAQAAQRFAAKYPGFEAKHAVARIARAIGTYC